MGLTIPPRASTSGDPGRAAAHRLALCGSARTLSTSGDDRLLLHLPRARAILDLFEQFCGARLTYNSIASAAPRGRAARLDRPGEPLHHPLPVARKEYEDLLTVNRSGSDARRAWALSRRRDRAGTSADAAGQRRRLRRAQGAAVLLVHHSTSRAGGTKGDTYDRYRIRMERCPVLPHHPQPRPPSRGEVPAKVRTYIKPPVGSVHCREPAGRAGSTSSTSQGMPIACLPLPLLRQPPGPADHVPRAAHRRRGGDHRIDRHRPGDVTA